MSDARLKAYLAGPDVFFPDAKELGAAKCDLAEAYGFEGLFPLDAELTLPEDDGAAAARMIFRANIELMDAADIVIANMSPFRGAGMDVGTAWELGYMHARGKRAFAYSLSDAAYLDRVLAQMGGDRAAETDPDGLTIEGFGAADNLMVVCGLVGEAPITRPAAPGQSHEDADMAAFEACLKLARATCDGG